MRNGHSARGLANVLHRVNGFDASVTMLQAMNSVRGGSWVAGAPTHIVSELLMELADRGYFLGVPDAGEPMSDGQIHHANASTPEASPNPAPTRGPRC